MEAALLFVVDNRWKAVVHIRKEATGNIAASVCSCAKVAARWTGRSSSTTPPPYCRWWSLQHGILWWWRSGGSDQIVELFLCFSLHPLGALQQFTASYFVVVAIRRFRSNSWADPQKRLLQLLRLSKDAILCCGDCFFVFLVPCLLCPPWSVLYRYSTGVLLLASRQTAVSIGAEQGWSTPEVSVRTCELILHVYSTSIEKSVSKRCIESIPVVHVLLSLAIYRYLTRLLLISRYMYVYRYCFFGVNSWLLMLCVKFCMVVNVPRRRETSIPSVHCRKASEIVSVLVVNTWYLVVYTRYSINSVPVGKNNSTRVDMGRKSWNLVAI